MKIKTRSLRYKMAFDFIASLLLAMILNILLILLCFVAFYANRPVYLFVANHLPLFFLLFAGIWVVLVILIYYGLTKKKLCYIDEMRLHLKTISKGDFSANMPIRTDDELGELAQGINQMATELKRLQEEQRAWEKGRYDLITNVSHDLRTPLTSILGYLDLVQNTAYEDEVKLRKYSDIAYQKCLDLQLLIDTLFEYSKVTEIDMKMNLISLNLAELLEQVIVSFIPQFQRADMAYELHISERISLIGDPLLLSRVFDNLIGNGIRHGKSGKRLRIELCSVQQESVPYVPDSPPDSRWAEIRVINYGPSISTKDLPFLFERYYKSATTSDSNGLGLAIVKAIIEKHNGVVSIESSEEETIFKILLPVH